MLLIFLLLGTILMAGTVAVIHQSVLPAFDNFEHEQSLTNLSRVEQALQAQLQALKTFNFEYAWWDDTYEYVQDPEAFPLFIEENLLFPELWFQNGIHMAALADSNQAFVWGITVGPDDANTELLQDNPQLAATVKSMFNGQLWGTDYDGLIVTPTDILLITSNPILKSDGSGPMGGQIVSGRFLNDSLVAKINEAASTGAAFYLTSDPDLPGFVQNTIASHSDSASTTLFRQTEETLYVSKLLKDVTGSPVVLVEVGSPKRISAIGANIVNTTLILLSLVIVLFIFSTWGLLRWLIAGPVFALKNHITAIRQSGDLTKTFSTLRKDEIGELSEEFDGLARELDQTQQQLKHARDDAITLAEVKSEFLATMSHEIRTPMNGVLGMAELLKGTTLDKRQNTFVQNIQNSGDMLLHVINDILDFSRIESGKLMLESQVFDLRSLVEETLDLMVIQANAKDLELMNSFLPEFDPYFVGDANRLRQILVNLIGNAIKFTHQGEVAVKVTVSGEDQDLKNVLFEIVDTGIGVSHEQQGKIFEEFSQADNSLARQYGGSGLGLSISSQLIALMGGEIGLESEPGIGSRFWFKLTLSTAHMPDQVRQSANELHGLRALIVDDNQTNRNILHAQMLGWKLDHEVASNGPQALSLLTEATAKDNPYKLVILDWHMPDMDGLEVARLIRADNTIAPLFIIMLSSVTVGQEESAVMKDFIDRFLTKPVHQSDLYNCLLNLTGNYRELAGKPQQVQSVTATNPTTFDADVLLVEDNVINQDVARFMLEKTGCRVEVAINGIVALDVLGDRHFDLILMDCHMPEMDGFETTQLIREKENSSELQTPIVALTAHVLNGVRERCLDVGMNDFLTKPFGQEQLQALLTTWLPRKSVH